MIMCVITILSYYYIRAAVAEVSLGKMLNPELPLIEQQSAAYRCTVWMCVWMVERKTIL